MDVQGTDPHRPRFKERNPWQGRRSDMYVEVRPRYRMNRGGLALYGGTHAGFAIIMAVVVGWRIAASVMVAAGSMSYILWLIGSMDGIRMGGEVVHARARWHEHAMPVHKIVRVRDLRQTGRYALSRVEIDVTGRRRPVKIHREAWSEHEVERVLRWFEAKHVPVERLVQRGWRYVPRDA